MATQDWMVLLQFFTLPEPEIEWQWPPGNARSNDLGLALCF